MLLVDVNGFGGLSSSVSEAAHLERFRATSSLVSKETVSESRPDISGARPDSEGVSFKIAFKAGTLELKVVLSIILSMANKKCARHDYTNSVSEITKNSGWNRWYWFNSLPVAGERWKNQSGKI